MFALDLVKNSNEINGALFTNYHLLHRLSKTVKNVSLRYKNFSVFVKN